MTKYVVKLTLEDALKLGIVFCECGHPPNNHFEWGPRSCAHCGCKKLKAHFSRGKAIKTKNRSHPLRRVLSDPVLD